MIGAVATVLILLLPNLACAETPATQEFSFFSSFIQMIAALSVVVGLILITRHFTAKLAGGGATRPGRHIRLVETRYLGPKKSLLLVEVGGEYFLLASTDQGINLIERVDLIEEIEVIEEGNSARPELLDALRRAVGKGTN